MITNYISLLESRTTTGRFDPGFSIDETCISEIIRLATCAPSAFNMQNWSFLAVHSPESKEMLMNLAYGQRQVKDAAVTIIVSGLTEAYVPLAEYLQPSVEAGILSENVQAAWVEMATASHKDNPQLQRDEAIRSASLVAMALTIAAREHGLDTGIVGGFDPDGISREFSLSSLELPVMLVTIGKAASGNWRQKIRRPVTEVLRFV